MFVHQEVMLCNIAVIVACYPNIEKDIQDHRKIKQCEIQPKILVAHKVLNRTVDSKNIEWFYQNIEEKQ